MRWLRDERASGMDVNVEDVSATGRSARAPGPAVARHPRAAVARGRRLAQVLPARRTRRCATCPSRSRAPATRATSATRSGSTAERAVAAVGRAHRRRHAVRHHSGGHLGARHRAHRGRPHHARRRLLLGAPRADRGAEVVALRDQPRLDRERDEGPVQRPARAAREQKRRGAAWASSGSRWTGSRSSGCTHERGLAAAPADHRVAGERARSIEVRQADRLRDERHAGRRSSRSTSRSRTCGRRTSRAGTEVEMEMTVEHRRKRPTRTIRKLPVLRPAEEARMTCL